MKLKYYLRGLGTGMAVAALIIGISAGKSGKNEMTDEEILARAKQLGLVERTVLSDMAKESGQEEISRPQDTVEEDTTQEDATDTDTVEADTADTDTAEADTIDTDTAETDTAEPDTAEPDTAESDTTESDTDTTEASKEFGMPDEAGTVTFSIVRGDSSDSVSRHLEEAGLVDNAAAYDKYLCQNGYDKSIRTGNYEIPANATGEEIAKMITGR